MSNDVAVWKLIELVRQARLLSNKKSVFRRQSDETSHGVVISDLTLVKLTFAGCVTAQKKCQIQVIWVIQFDKW